MPYAITEHGDYVRGVIGDKSTPDDFIDFYKELQGRCKACGCDRALVIVTPAEAALGPNELHTYKQAGFLDGFRLALVCAAWTLYQACNEAERAAEKAKINVRAFFRETEAMRWLLGTS
jgi:hypothetical protein